MITGIILIVLALIGFYIGANSYKYDYLGIIIGMMFGCWFLMHLIFISTVSYEYERFVIKRQAFIDTLNNARENGYKFESASISRDVAGWNTTLAMYKYKNTIFFIEQYTDDRIDNLKPIK